MILWQKILGHQQVALNSLLTTLPNRNFIGRTAAALYYTAVLYPNVPVPIFPCTHMSCYSYVLVPICPCTHMSWYPYVLLPIFPCTHMSCTHMSCTHVSYTHMSWSQQLCLTKSSLIQKYWQF